MRSIFFFLVLLPFSCTTQGQSYADNILQFRKQYTADLLADKRAPINESEVKYLSFFAPDSGYCVWADFTATPGITPFLMPTHSGKDKPFREYGTLSFTLKNAHYTLHVYQSIDLMQGNPANTYLFLPFTDETNYETTYAGGRYIDLSVNDIKNNKVQIDFNKCYNPYCAYADGFSCPIPPRENRLETEINAGEKTFSR